MWTKTREAMSIHTDYSEMFVLLDFNELEPSGYTPLEHRIVCLEDRKDLSQEIMKEAKIARKIFSFLTRKESLSFACAAKSIFQPTLAAAGLSPSAFIHKLTSDHRLTEASMDKVDIMRNISNELSPLEKVREDEFLRLEKSAVDLIAGLPNEILGPLFEGIEEDLFLENHLSDGICLQIYRTKWKAEMEQLEDLSTERQKDEKMKSIYLDITTKLNEFALLGKVGIAIELINIIPDGYYKESALANLVKCFAMKDKRIEASFCQSFIQGMSLRRSSSFFISSSKKNASFCNDSLKLIRASLDNEKLSRDILKQLRHDLIHKRWELATNAVSKIPLDSFKDLAYQEIAHACVQREEYSQGVRFSYKIMNTELRQTVLEYIFHRQESRHLSPLKGCLLS